MRSRKEVIRDTLVATLKAQDGGAVVEDRPDGPVDGYFDLSEVAAAIDRALDAREPEVADAIQCELGFEIGGRFYVEQGVGPGIQGGDELRIWTTSPAPVEAVVTKTFNENGRTVINFSTTAVKAIALMRR